jgi:hypothetical protein
MKHVHHVLGAMLFWLSREHRDGQTNQQKDDGKMQQEG